MKRKVFAVLLSSLMLLVLFSPSAFAATEHDLSNGPVTISAGSGDHIITGTYTGTSTAISIGDNYTGTVTLNNVSATVEFSTSLSNGHSSGLSTGTRVNLTLNLVGGNKISAPGTAVAIDGSPSTLTINGNGFLDAVSTQYDGAGIGSNASAPYSGNAGKIIIESGTIRAYGSDEGAGIGGSFGHSATYINIKGGHVEAYGGVDAAGIGGGTYGGCGEVVIEGGYVEAYSGSDDPAGIGYGISIGPKGGSVTVKGNAVVLAHARGGGSSIGWADGDNFPLVSIQESADVTVFSPVRCDTFELADTAKFTAFMSDRQPISATTMNLGPITHFVSGVVVTSKTSKVTKALSSLQASPLQLVDSVTGDTVADGFALPVGHYGFVRSVTTSNPVKAYAEVEGVRKQFYNVSASTLRMTPYTTPTYEYVTPVEPETATYTVEYYLSNPNGDEIWMGSSAPVTGLEPGTKITLAGGNLSGQRGYMRPASGYSPGIQQGTVPFVLVDGANTIKVLYTYTGN